MRTQPTWRTRNRDGASAEEVLVAVIAAIAAIAASRHDKGGEGMDGMVVGMVVVVW